MSSSYAKEKLVVAGLNFPPYIIQNPQEPLSGIVIDQINEIAEQADIDVEFRITNWARALEEARTGRVDAVIPTMFGEERAVYLDFPKHELIKLKAVLFSHANADINFSGDVLNLKKYAIGKLNNARVSPAFDLAVEQRKIKVFTRNSVDLLMTAVAHKRLDLVGIDIYLGLWVARKNGFLDQIKFIDPPLGEVPVYLALSKKRKSKIELKKLENAINLINSNGRRQKIIDSYVD